MPDDGKDALTVIEEQVAWAQDRMLYTAIDHITANLDTFPGIGMGLAFVQSSAKKMVVKRLEHDILPEIEEHVEMQMAYIAELAATDDRGEIDELFAEQLLGTDPFLSVLDTDKVDADAVRDEVLAHVQSVGHQAADWVEAADGETFDSYAELAVYLDKSPETVAGEIDDIMHYIDLLEEHRDAVDMSRYSRMLRKDEVHDWFVTHLIQGLEKGRQDVIGAVTEQIREEHRIQD